MQPSFKYYIITALNALIVISFYRCSYYSPKISPYQPSFTMAVGTPRPPRRAPLTPGTCAHCACCTIQLNRLPALTHRPCLVPWSELVGGWAGGKSYQEWLPKCLLTKSMLSFDGVGALCALFFFLMHCQCSRKCSTAIANVSV